MNSFRPKIEILGSDNINIIIEKAVEILSDAGIYIGSDNVMNSLKEHAGIEVLKGNIIKVKQETIEKCIKSTPSSFTVYPQDGLDPIYIGGNEVHFVAGSLGTHVIDRRSHRRRKPVSNDLIEHIKVLNQCHNIDFQSGSFLLSDVPREITSSYRYYLSILYSPKPMFGGAWDTEDFIYIKEMLTVLAGSEEELKRRPPAVICTNPSSPLGLTKIVSENIVGCSKAMLPAMLVPIPLAGGSSPVTLAGTLVQHTAENLGSLVLSQLSNPGAPLLFGGGPGILEMGKGTACQAATEAVMLGCAIAAIGKRLGLPTATNIGRADSKCIDYQAGEESGIALTMMALAGINMIRGSGTLEFCDVVSLEKLLLDNEICGMAKRLIKGIRFSPDTLAVDLIKELGLGYSSEGFIGAKHTRDWFKSEIFMPSDIIDRSTRREFEENGEKDALARAVDRIEAILARYQPREVDADKKKELDRIIKKHAQKYGMKDLPISDVH